MKIVTPDTFLREFFVVVEDDFTPIADARDRIVR